MANIVELRELGDEKLEEMVENLREEMFNLRFRKASAQLEDYTRLKQVRREIAQLETVLSNRQLAIDTAASKAEIAAILAKTEWSASCHFNYEDSVWQVSFVDNDGKDIVSANVNLNKKKPSKRSGKGLPELVTSYEVVG